MARYELSKAADKDFEDIFNFGLDTFGIAQALDYQVGLEQRFAELAEQPGLYVAVDDIRQGYRRSVYNAHSIYYRVETKYVLIVRILGQQDPDRAL
jgi:toxin ParE1/3/4